MIHRQFAVYILVGLLSAFIDIATMQLLIKSGLNIGLATTMGYAFVWVLNYFLHAKITFRSHRSHASMIKYCVLVLINYLLTMGMVFCSVYLVDNALPGKILSLPLMAVNGFLLSNYWIYK